MAKKYTPVPRVDFTCKRCKKPAQSSYRNAVICRACRKGQWLGKVCACGSPEKLTGNMKYCSKCRPKLWIGNKYGIRPDEYSSMLASQGGRCAICRRTQERFRLAVDHCHRTGRVRGLLCVKCNAGLGQFQDDSGLLTAAINYLSGF